MRGLHTYWRNERACVESQQENEKKERVYRERGMEGV
jgi:hypothetical protein